MVRGIGSTESPIDLAGDGRHGHGKSEVSSIKWGSVGPLRFCLGFPERSQLEIAKGKLR